MLKGKYINIRKIDEDDLNYFKTWFGQPDYFMAMSGSFFDSAANKSFIIEDNVNIYGNRQYFILEDKKGNTIGFVLLSSIQWRNKNLCLEIYLNNKDKGQGYGGEAILLAVSYAFWNLNMHKVSMFINEFNENALKMAFKTSKLEGKLRNNIFYNGRYWDVYVFGILKHEFEGQIEKAVKCGFDYLENKKYF
jgi:RimJ/RimL family protein N-acetyltransferase